MKTKYIISIKRNPDTIIGGLFGDSQYVRRYRSNYEYLERTFCPREAKAFATRRAAENAAEQITGKYSQLTGYEILEVRRVQ